MDTTKTYGYHTPGTTTKVFNKISEETNIKWHDSSFKNDACDSMCHTLDDGTDITIYLPNSVFTDSMNEYFETFAVDINGDIVLDGTLDIGEVIDFVDQYISGYKKEKLDEYNRMLNALERLKEAHRDATSIWQDNASMFEDVLGLGYPYDKCFNDLYVDVKVWVDSFAELTNLINNRNNKED